MGWSIGVIDNTVEITGEVATAIFAADTHEHFYDADEVTYKGRLTFNDDHGEHMDYVDEPAIQKVLLDAKVNGRIAFASVEGDNSGRWWAYTFRDGVCETTEGKIKDLIP